MPSFKVAHIKEQGVDLIIIPLESNFGLLSSSRQEAETAELQMRTSEAGLRGTVVPVWEFSNQTMFRAPQNFHPFFRGVSLEWVLQNINREISW